MSSSSASAVAALQRALQAEQAASYGYGVAGAYLPQGSAEQATAGFDWTAHLRSADDLTSMISARGGTPAAAQVAYQLPAPGAVGGGGQSARGHPGRPGRAGLPERGRAPRDGAAELRGRPGPGGSAAGRGLARVSPGVPWPARGQPAQLAARYAASARIAPRIRRKAGATQRDHPANGTTQAQLPMASTCSIIAAAPARSSLTAIRSAHDHQNHHSPSCPRPA